MVECTNTIKYRNKTLDTKFGRLEATEEFICKNRFELCRTQEEIVNKALQDLENGFMQFELEILIDYIHDWDNQKKFYKEQLVKEVEDGSRKPPEYKIISLEESCQDFLDYMLFAWEKALDERGISAGRSISKLGIWLWLMGREDLYELIRRADLYIPYGSPALIAVCNELGIEIPDELLSFSKNVNT